MNKMRVHTSLSDFTEYPQNIDIQIITNTYQISTLDLGLTFTRLFHNIHWKCNSDQTLQFTKNKSCNSL